MRNARYKTLALECIAKPKMATINRKLKQEIWNRLTSDPTGLGLDLRISERPADHFARIAAAGRREQVVAALRSLLVEIIGGTIEADPGKIASFLANALPLCDSLAAVECKPILKQFLLHDKPDDWQGKLSEIQELASRALVGVTKDKSDFRFWADVAQKSNSCLPYAINAAIEIDLDPGLELLCSSYSRCLKDGLSQIVDWAVVLDLAVARYGESTVERSLHRVCAKYKDGEQVQEHLAQRVAGRPGLSHRGKRDLGEIASGDTVLKGISWARTDKPRDIDALDLGQDYTSIIVLHAQKPRRDLAEVEDMYRGDIRAQSRYQDWMNYKPVLAEA